MPSDLASYLAANYLSADAPGSKSKPKKRKRKQNEGLIITDDDTSAWGSNADAVQDGDNATPVTVAGSSAEFRKSKKSNWKTLGGGESSKQADARITEADADAEAILASAAAETEAARGADDEAPVIEGGETMADGTLAGLQSAASVSAQMKRQRKKEREEWEREHGGEPKQEEETAFRDAQGRRVDVSLQREAARRAVLEEEERDEKAKDALRGDVQAEGARVRRQALQDAKHMTVARGVDDEAMNRELKGQQRWNDPMAQFLTEKNVPSAGCNKLKGRPTYSGSAVPNRYGIRPGYRWDGVDRGNGFEAERFKALNKRERNKGLEYAWQMDE